ncbi:hypothetical protein VPH35_030862 [Triticum aestivum]
MCCTMEALVEVLSPSEPPRSASGTILLVSNFSSSPMRTSSRPPTSPIRFDVEEVPTPMVTAGSAAGSRV